MKINICSTIIKKNRKIVGFLTKLFHSLLFRKKGSNGEIHFLPEEIIINILKRLPVKSLKRCECVCKHWKHLIKTPSFIQQHLNRSAHQNPNLLLHRNQIKKFKGLFCLLDCHLKFHEVKYPPLITSLDCIHVIGSSNGLICLAYRQNHSRFLLLWNPATREVRQLSMMNGENFNGACFFGFGFSHVVNDYKVVIIYKNVVVCRAEVYSLSTGLWKEIGYENLIGVSLIDNAVTANGVLFWYGRDQEEEQLGTNAYVMVSFDMATEVFTMLKWTPVGYSCRLAVYENKLALLYHSHMIWNSLYYCLNLCVMEKEGETWSSSKKYIFSRRPYRLHVVTIWRDRIVCLNGYSKVGLLLFNVATNECEKLPIPVRCGCYRLRIFNYVESLVPISSNNETEEF